MAAEYTPPRRVYAVLYGSTWHIAELVAAGEYSSSLEDRDVANLEKPVWAEYPSTAMICEYDAADRVVSLREPS